MLSPATALTFVSPFSLHTEAEDVLARLLGQLFAVDIKAYLLLVGVDLDLDFILRAVRKRFEQIWTNGSSLHHAL